ncbi:MAG: hypothetical protein WCW17_02905 [Patescibacteria group bacterium]|jgi:DNA polymerase III delta prime subunit
MLELFFKQIKQGTYAHAYLFIGASAEIQQQIIESFEAGISEIEIVDDGKIESVRNIKNFLSSRPIRGDIKLVAVKNAEVLSIPAQNSLLKILEEPPKYGVLLLFSKNSDLMLDTIKSRCQTVNLKKMVKKYDFSEIINLRTMTLAEKFKKAEKWAKNDDLTDLLNSWLSYFHSLITEEKDVIRIIRNIQEAKADLATNVNKRLLLEKILLDF